MSSKSKNTQTKTEQVNKKDVEVETANQEKCNFKIPISIKTKNNIDVLVQRSGELCIAYERLKNVDLNFVWKGSKIPFDVWCEVIAFHRYSSKKHNGHETQGRFFYNPKTLEWANVVYPQNGRGMSTTEEKTSETINEIRRQYKFPWRCLGTHHNHCNTSAFQSATDHSDEIDQAGFHITFGDIKDTTFDSHIRFTCFGENYEFSNLAYWVDFEKAETSELYKNAIETIGLKNLAIKHIKSLGYGVPKLWESMSNVDWYFHMKAEGWNTNRFAHTILLSLEPNLEDYKEKIEFWDSIVKTGYTTTYYPPHTGGFPRGSRYAYTPQGYMVEDFDEVYVPDPSIQSKGDINISAFLEYLDDENSKKAFTLIHWLVKKYKYDFNHLQHVASIPRAAKSNLPVKDVVLWDSLERSLNNSANPFTSVDQYAKLFEPFNMLGFPAD